MSSSTRRPPPRCSRPGAISNPPPSFDSRSRRLQGQGTDGDVGTGRVEVTSTVDPFTMAFGDGTHELPIKVALVRALEPVSMCSRQSLKSPVFGFE